MLININSKFDLESKDADKILKLAYLKGYLKHEENVQSGCDIFKYDPVRKIVEFHIKKPLIWVKLRLDQVIDCQIDLIERQAHRKKRKLQ